MLTAYQIAQIRDSVETTANFSESGSENENSKNSILCQCFHISLRPNPSDVTGLIDHANFWVHA